MNERIRELWNKAAESTAAYPSGQNNSWETQVNFLDKFAELIVRECVAICQDVDGEDNIDARSGRQDCAVEIQEHFGVEEK
jgi:hypothetical protein